MKLHSDFTATMYAIPERGDSANEDPLAAGSLGAALDRTEEGGRANVILSDRKLPR